MGIFIKHILRNLEEKIGRTLLITFTLMGVGVIVSFCFIMLYGIADLVKSVANNVYFFDYSIESVRMPLSYEKLESMSDDLVFMGIKTIEDGYIINNKNEKTISLSSFEKEKAAKFGILDQFNGYELKDNEALVNQEGATSIGKYIGEKFTYYNSEGTPIELTVKYIDKGRFTGSPASIYVNDATYNLINTNKDKENVYEMFLAKYIGKEPINEFNKKLYELEDDYGYDFHYMDVADELLGEFGDLFKIFILFLLLGSIIVFFVLNSIVKIIMEERIPIVGSFRSVGASNKTMTILLICEMGIYGLVGGLIGSTLSGSLLGSLFQLIYSAETMFGVNEGNNVPLLMVIFTTLLMIIFQIILSITEILSFKEMTIKECMFNSKQRRFKRSITKLFIGISMLIIAIYSAFLGYKLNFYFGLISLIALFTAIAFLLPFITHIVEKIFKRDGNPILTMAFNTINNNKLQISTNVIICILITLSISFISFFSYFVTNNIKKLDYVKSDLYAETSLINAQNEIMTIDNVSTISTLYQTTSLLNNLKLANNPIPSLKITYSDNVDHLEESCNKVQTDFKVWKNLKNDELIIDEYYAQKYGLKIGDIVKISWLDEGKKINYGGDIDLKIVALSDTNILTTDTALKLASPGTQQMFINVKDKSKMDDTIEQIKKHFDALDVIQTKEEYKKAKKEANKALFVLILTIIGFVVGVGIIGITNNQAVSFIERSKELAILYSTCMSRKQLSHLVLREIGISYLIASIISIGYGYLLIRILQFTLDNFGDYRDLFKLEFSILWILVFLVFIAIIMSTIYLSVKKKIKKMNIVEELKYE